MPAEGGFVTKSQHNRPQGSSHLHLLAREGEGGLQLRVVEGRNQGGGAGEGWRVEHRHALGHHRHVHLRTRQDRAGMGCGGGG